MLNVDLKAVGEKRFLQLCELDEQRPEAYESSCFYKEKTKQWHHNCVLKKRLEEGDVPLFLIPS